MPHEEFPGNGTSLFGHGLYLRVRGIACMSAKRTSLRGAPSATKPAHWIQLTLE